MAGDRLVSIMPWSSLLRPDGVRGLVVLQGREVRLRELAHGLDPLRLFPPFEEPLHLFPRHIEVLPQVALSSPERAVPLPVPLLIDGGRLPFFHVFPLSVTFPSEVDPFEASLSSGSIRDFPRKVTSDFRRKSQPRNVTPEGGLQTGRSGELVTGCFGGLITTQISGDPVDSRHPAGIGDRDYNYGALRTARTRPPSMPPLPLARLSTKPSLKWISHALPGMTATDVEDQYLFESAPNTGSIEGEKRP